MNGNRNGSPERALNKHTGAVLGLVLGIIGGSLLLNVAGPGPPLLARLGAALATEEAPAARVGASNADGQEGPVLRLARSLAPAPPSLP